MSRSSMAALITRVRDLINDNNPPGSSTWSDDQIQDVLDESREDLVNFKLIERPTYSGSTIQFLDYYSDSGNWETDFVIKQRLVTVVTPSVSEVIPGHFQFATNTWPPCYITGKRYDCFRAAADLLERWAAKWVLSVDIVVNAQQFRQSQAAMALQKLAQTYRKKQRPRSMPIIRSDLKTVGGDDSLLSLRPNELDYMASGSKDGS